MEKVSLPPRVDAAHRLYWRLNLQLMCALLAIWAVAGLGCGVLWADYLNRWNLPGTGYPLGFWFAHQGSIIVFVGLVLIYAIGMNLLDRKLKAAVMTAKNAEAKA
jgi:putative solute:sodium symporter small subunit